MPTASSERRAEGASWLIGLLWTGVGLLAFHGTVDVWFTQDDFWFLEAAARPMPNRAMFAGVLPDYVRPLPSYWLPVANRALFGLDASGHHLVLLGLYAIAVFGLFRCLWLRFDSLLAASFGAALYALSEVHLFTLGWISGANDVVCATGLALALWAMSRPGGGRPLFVVLPFVVALLSKEHAVVLPAAFVGSLLVAACVAGRGERLRRPDRRLVIWFAVTGAFYVAFWIAMTRGASAGRTLGFDPGRMTTVLRHSLLVIHPILDCGERIGSAWLVAPFALIAVSVAVRGRNALPAAAFGLLLWGLPAAIFALTTRPVELQEYYAHFSVFGLALLLAQAVAAAAGVRGLRWPLLILLATYAAVSVVRRVDDVAARRSPSLFLATYSGAAHEQIEAAMARHPARRIVFLGASERMWWAMGKGAMVTVLYPGVESVFDGFDGADVPPDTVTNSSTLVLRQTGERRFEVVL